MGRRYVRISCEFLAGLLKGGDRPAWRVNDPVPDDARIVGMTFLSCGMVSLLLESDAWPDDDGARTLEPEPRFEEIRTADVSGKVSLAMTAEPSRYVADLFRKHVDMAWDERAESGREPIVLEGGPMDGRAWDGTGMAWLDVPDPSRVLGAMFRYLDTGRRDPQGRRIFAERADAPPESPADPAPPEGETEGRQPTWRELPPLF
jgi:hypothetical protein